MLSPVCAAAYANENGIGTQAGGGAARPVDDEIVVTGERRGEAEVPAEAAFEEDEIASHGADTIGDLIQRLLPLVDSGSENPVILINGKPVGFDRSILSYPAEALDRLAVLQANAAAHYGEQSGRRVVNLVLKQKFSSLTMDVSTNFATDGGQYGGDFDVNRTAIAGDTRWNVQARASGDSALMKSSRNIAPQSGIFDKFGFVSGLNGDEIDPALSLAAGQAVTISALLLLAANSTATLADFLNGANQTHLVDPNAYETLLPQRRSARLSLGLTRPIGSFSASFHVAAARSTSDAMVGLPMASVVVPAGNPYSPFGQDVLLTRPLAGERALRSATETKSFSSTLNLNGKLAGWDTSLSLSYSQGRSNNLLESGFDLARLQPLITGGMAGLNPFGLWTDDLLVANRNSSSSSNLGARLNLRKGIFTVPAGRIFWTLTGNINQNHVENERIDAQGALIAATRINRNQLDGQSALTLPITRRSDGMGRHIGDLSADVTAGIQTMTDSRVQQRFGSTVNWSPFRTIQLRGSYYYQQSVPSVEQLDAPILEVVERIFDYARQEVAEPVYVTGGNPNLRSGSRETATATAIVRPFGGQALTLNFAYRQSNASGAVSSFPELTPAIEAAFPDRVTRDGEGRLVRLDARSINIARASDSNLSSGLALRFVPNPSVTAADPTAEPMHLSFAITHRMLLQSEWLTREGVAVMDQLRGGGQSRHDISIEGAFGKRGFGLSINGHWASKARLDGGGDSDSDFFFTPPITVNLSAFVEPDRLWGHGDLGAWLADMKITIKVQNLLNGYRQVRLADGSMPAGYSRDEIEPLGRTARVTFRKKF